MARFTRLRLTASPMACMARAAAIRVPSVGCAFATSTITSSATTSPDP